MSRLVIPGFDLFSRAAAAAAAAADIKADEANKVLSSQPAPHPPLPLLVVMQAEQNYTTILESLEHNGHHFDDILFDNGIVPEYFKTALKKKISDDKYNQIIRNIENNTKLAIGLKDTKIAVQDENFTNEITIKINNKNFILNFTHGEAKLPFFRRKKDQDNFLALLKAELQTQTQKQTLKSPPFTGKGKELATSKEKREEFLKQCNDLIEDQKKVKLKIDPPVTLSNLPAGVAYDATAGEITFLYFTDPDKRAEMLKSIKDQSQNSEMYFTSDDLVACGRVMHAFTSPVLNKVDYSKIPPIYTNKDEAQVVSDLIKITTGKVPVDKKKNFYQGCTPPAVKIEKSEDFLPKMDSKQFFDSFNSTTAKRALASKRGKTDEIMANENLSKIHSRLRNATRALHELENSWEYKIFGETYSDTRSKVNQFEDELKKLQGKHDNNNQLTQKDFDKLADLYAEINKGLTKVNNRLVNDKGKNTGSYSIALSTGRGLFSKIFVGDTLEKAAAADFHLLEAKYLHLDDDDRRQAIAKELVAEENKLRLEIGAYVNNEITKLEEEKEKSLTPLGPIKSKKLANFKKMQSNLANCDRPLREITGALDGITGARIGTDEQGDMLKNAVELHELKRKQFQHHEFNNNEQLANESIRNAKIGGPGGPIQTATIAALTDMETELDNINNAYTELKKVYDRSSPESAEVVKDIKNIKNMIDHMKKPPNEPDMSILQQRVNTLNKKIDKKLEQVRKSVDSKYSSKIFKYFRKFAGTCGAYRNAKSQSASGDIDSVIKDKRNDLMKAAKALSLSDKKFIATDKAPQAAKNTEELKKRLMSRSTPSPLKGAKP